MGTHLTKEEKNKMLARAKAAASNASVKAKDGKDKGVAKLLTAINNLRPILRAGGYAIEAVELKERENPPLTRFQKGVVAMLIRTEQLESTVRRKKYEIELIIIETGLIPSLTLRLVPQDPTEA